MNPPTSAGSDACTHLYVVPGVYTVTVTASDPSRNATAIPFQYVVAYDPNGDFVTGGGWITSPRGAYLGNPTLTGRANFGFNSKYHPGATQPSGVTEFQFQVAKFDFHAEMYQWLVVAGAQAQYKGSGTINGTGHYGFLLTATDAPRTTSGGGDTFRIQIWDSVASTVIYDNQLGAADDAAPRTAIGGGNIVVHAK